MNIAFPLSVALVALASSTPCAGFTLPFTPKANPAVGKYADAQEDALLEIRLDVGQAEGDRLGVDGLLLELGNAEAAYEHPGLPGADGPPHSRRLSSGGRSLSVLRPGRFVDLTGSRCVDLEHGAWEMIWREHAKAGALICGFDLPEEVRRNSASIPAGKIYLTFPVWTQETLQELRDTKAEVGERAAEMIDRFEKEKRLMADTPNLLMKALHFRNACKAAEDLDYSGHRQYQAMPVQRDMIALAGDLRLCTLGTVWTKGSAGLLGSDHILLGSAVAKAGERGAPAGEGGRAERKAAVAAVEGLRP